jgi:hypothetical protein
MEERRTAAVVLLIIALIVIFFTFILPEIQYRSIHTLTFKSCNVHYYYINKGLVDDGDRAANNRLALCLCTIYMQKPDTAIARKLLDTYRKYGSHSRTDSASYLQGGSLDSIINNKGAIFDTTITID